MGTDPVRDWYVPVGGGCYRPDSARPRGGLPRRGLADRGGVSYLPQCADRPAMDDSDDGIPDVLTPTFEHAFDLDVVVEEPIEIGDTGDGERRIIPIKEGTVSGRIEGHVLPGGADFQLFRVDRPSELVAKYAIETADGDRIYVQNRGMRFADPAVSERIREGKPVDPEDVYFCSVPEFEVATPELEWLENRIFVATGTRQPKGVKLAVYQVG